MKIITTAIFTHVILSILLCCTPEEKQTNIFCSTEYEARTTPTGEWSICNPFKQELIYKIYPSENTDQYYVKNEDGNILVVNYIESSLIYDTVESNGKVLRVNYSKARPSEGTHDYLSVSFLKIFEQENCCAYIDDIDSDLGLAFFNTGEPKFNMIRITEF